MASLANDSDRVTVRGSIRRSLRLLSKRDRRLFIAIVFVQMVSLLLDLAGVVLLGLVAIMATASSQGNAFPAVVTNTAHLFVLGNVGQQGLIGLVGGLAALLLVAKSLGMLLVLRRSFRFLADRAALLSARLSSRFFSSSLLAVQARPSQETAFALAQGTTSAVLGILGAGMILATETALLVLLGAALFLVDPAVAIGAVVYFAFVAGLMQKPLSRWAGRIGRITAATEIASTTVVQEGIDCYREVSVLDRRGFYPERHREQRILGARASADSQFLSLIPKSAMEVALVVGAVVVLWSL